MNLAKTVCNHAEAIIEGYKAYLVDCTVRGEHGTRVVEVFVDSDSGVTTELCASISRDLAARLDAAEIIHGRYRLEVSSPGLDRPLKLYRQYPKNIGRTLKVKYTMEGTAVTVVGKLVTVKENSIMVENEEGTAVEIPIAGILRATVEPRFK
ncbi:MAG: ribosome maturation factor [Bacteroidota bacterium]